MNNKLMEFEKSEKDLNCENSLMVDRLIQNMRKKNLHFSRIN